MLRIFNPIYDQAFKYLLDNNEIAKKILYLILDKEIVQLQMQNVETPVNTKDGVLISRYDFKAVIRDETGEMQKVLIELQKYKTSNVIDRFRDYLGQNLSREDTFVDEKGQTITEHLPIISVYILGYDIPVIPTRLLRVDNKYFDGIRKIDIDEIKDDLIKFLTPQMVVLLVGEKKNYKWQGTPIESFIRLFHQKNIGEAKNIFIEIDDSDVKDPIVKEIANRLYEATLNEQLQRQMRAEKDYEETYKNNLDKDIEIQDLKKQKEEERKQKEEARQREEEERRQKEEARQKLFESVREMKKFGMPIELIIKATGLSKDNIEQL